MRKDHQTIIDAILGKIERDCPGMVDMVALYGSVVTGDMHERSDLDLMILINDDIARLLTDTFILEDIQVGYDIYCTTWEMIEEDSDCFSAHISRLMEPEIIYVRDDSVLERFEELQERARRILSSRKRYYIAKQLCERVCRIYAETMRYEHLNDLRAGGAYMISLYLDAVMIRSGRWFRLGTKRTWDELKGVKLPENFRKDVYRVVRAKRIPTLKKALMDLALSASKFTGAEFEQRVPPLEEKDPDDRPLPTAGILTGSYEESFSNWRNKMYEAADNNDVLSSFMNLAGLYHILKWTADRYDLRVYGIMEDFDPFDLYKNAKIFDEKLEELRLEYNRAGLIVERYRDADEFVGHYLRRYRTDEYRYITLRDLPDIEDTAAEWFSSKWGVPKQAYLECMDAYLSEETEYGWYLCLKGNEIVGGLGVIENDFHDRKDLAPNVCAVYTEPGHRYMGIAGKLLNMTVEDLRYKGITPLYLVTDHTGFYEKYGWEFYCMAQGDGEDHLTRVYIHR